LPFVTVDNARLYYRLEGNDDRPALILSHSLGVDHGLWDPQMPDLLPHFRVVRYDSRGHGASDSPPGDYSIELLARDVLGLAAALGIDKFAFCGLSLGGSVPWLRARLTV
jgi:pimeloyl-ACP methyl ester carboxylesterase